MKQSILLLAVTLLAAASAPSETDIKKTIPAPQWELISECTTATVYNAVASQCNADCMHTASMYSIVPDRITEDHILAMERTMMAEFGITYGDTVLVQGAGRYDGTWQVQDTMNKRFSGQHKIDFLVPNHIRHGKWTDVKVYKKHKNNNPINASDEKKI